MTIPRRSTKHILTCATLDSFSTALCSCKTATYSFPALCCDLTSLVARSMHTMRQPVTLGSNVPLWPVFCTRKMRLIHETTSCEEGFDGLSKQITPLLKNAGEQIFISHLSLNIVSYINQWRYAIFIWKTKR